MAVGGSRPTRPRAIASRPSGRCPEARRRRAGDAGRARFGILRMTAPERHARAAAGESAAGGISPAARERLAQSFTRVEDVVYIGLGILLAVGALSLLIHTGVTYGRELLVGNIPAPVIDLLDRVLLVVMF